MTNIEVGNLLDLTHSTVSKLRNGTRSPSIDTMLRVATAMHWPISEQLTAKIDDTYHIYLEHRIKDYAQTFLK